MMIIIGTGCNFAITASEEPSAYRLAIYISDLHQAEFITATTPNLQFYNLTDAVVVYEEEQVNSSVCNISSLEVYRGRKKAIEISHNGFSLSERATIEVLRHAVLINMANIMFNNNLGKSY